MKNIILYVNKGNQEYEVIKCKDLKEGHTKFTEYQNKGNYTYLELGIDKVDIDGTYTIVRKLTA